MDSITQAALGAAIGESILGSKLKGKGAIIGALVATIPDLDVALYLFYDSYEMLSIHRGFSHSILFSVLCSFLIVYLIQRFKWGKEISYIRLWMFTWLTLITHMLLDAFTSYGTQLFLPFSNARVSWDSINVVDPVYTLPLIIGVLLSVYVFNKSPLRSRPNTIGIIISTIYLLTTIGVKNHVDNYFKNELTSNNIQYKTLMTMPVGIANINWYGVAKTSDSLYIRKYSLFSKKEESLFESFPINDNLLNTLNSEVADKMRWFAKGNYTVLKDGSKIRIYNLQVDMRGVVKDEENKFPTKGYFEITPLDNNDFDFSSGAHQSN
jgi:inner membrane protein